MIHLIPSKPPVDLCAVEVDIFGEIHILHAQFGNVCDDLPRLSCLRSMKRTSLLQRSRQITNVSLISKVMLDTIMLVPLAIRCIWGCFLRKGG